MVIFLTLALIACSAMLISCDGLFGDKECDDHQMDEWYEETPPSYTVDGVRRRDCKNCDFYQMEPIPAAHSYGDWVVDTAATCTTDGSRHRNCTACDSPESETVTALGHDYTIEVSSSSATCGVAGSKVMRCSRCNGTDNQVIPATYQGLPVTEIRQYAFQNNTDILSLVISDSVKSIGLSAFGGCTNLASVTFGNGLEQIYCSFNDCRSLTEIVILDSVTSIDNYAFSDCDNLTMVVLGTGIKSIGYKCFSDGNDNLRLCYKGSPEDRDNNEIHIFNGNPSLTYYSESNPYDVSPDADNYYLIMNRSYWHYDVDGKTVVLWLKQA